MPKSSPEKLARRISAKCNYLPPETVIEVYQGLLRVIVEDLRSGGRIILPDLGTFKTILHKGRAMTDIHTKRRVRLPQKLTIKFEPGARMKAYFDNLTPRE